LSKLYLHAVSCAATLHLVDTLSYLPHADRLTLMRTRGPRLTIATRLAAVLVCAGMTTLAVPLALASPRCTKTCRRETAACKQTQCTGLAGEPRRACVQSCNERGGGPPGGT